MAADLVAVARELVNVLDEIAEGDFDDEALIQRAKKLNLGLASVYTRMYGATPLISTDYPHHVWWPRAREHASQALAALESGYASDNTSSKPARTRARGGDGIARLKALEPQVLDLLADSRHRYFDPLIVQELYQRYATAVERLHRSSHDVFGDVPLREIPPSSGTTENDGRGYIERPALEQLRRDIRYCLDLEEYTSPEPTDPTVEARARRIVRRGRRIRRVPGAPQDHLGSSHVDRDR